MSKTLVITGGSKGIGAATAAQFLAAGYQVVNLSRSPNPQTGIDNVAVDMSQRDWTEKSAATVLDAVGKPEQLVLIHNAAVLAKDSMQTVAAQGLRDVLELNIIAASELNQLLLPRMSAGSSILYISSTLGTKAVAGTYSYVVSKHAVIGQMRATCQDLAGTGIHTACVCPGFTDTEMLRTHLGADESIYQSIAAGSTMGRLIEPGEIAESLWFCSQNPVINGSLLHANLGQIEN